MKHNGPRLAFVSLALALALAPGCRRRYEAEPVNPERAREVLRTTLTAWQNGESAESLKKQWPAIVAADPKWKAGHKLVRYEVAADDLVVGGDLQCQVTLVLKGPNGKETQEKAVFAVSTSPALVVVRTEN